MHDTKGKDRRHGRGESAWHHGFNLSIIISMIGSFERVVTGIKRAIIVIGRHSINCEARENISRWRTSVQALHMFRGSFFLETWQVHTFRPSEEQESGRSGGKELA